MSRLRLVIISLAIISSGVANVAFGQDVYSGSGASGYSGYDEGDRSDKSNRSDNSIFDKRENSGCSLSPCHGLNLQCVETREDIACNMMYALGDKCRSLAKCERVSGRCKLILPAAFQRCKRCVEKCDKENRNDPMDAFSCEATCEAD